MSMNDFIIRNLTGPPIQPSKAAVGMVERKKKNPKNDKHRSDKESEAQSSHQPEEEHQQHLRDHDIDVFV
ncbi:hypothetical protein [Celerinatantimonas sp. YJH-8]|uniref:hypothetical protein n=1 Tax=Celerinatantimonas sp. YJH-8 TaxID=3228714 RepID=UPI0038C0D0FD